ncbi:SAM-dependent methyltransferase [Streptomyces sp. AN091965]|uniref:SAM-dependent methyltransferase n=1 Tax=Streptomyces sp. AN091965 TaxID=2927803 RepID=UPI001F623895|nr:SAM-dependent methyltransferase [Streptomyces sp. AN091965]MCI3934485.1 SAM-dependent methyltransferase [Streptomyces sp. AN091965]
MERPAWAPPGIDIAMPSAARINDCYLGGSYNFEADRDAARRAMEFLPGFPKIVQANRAFTRRAVRFAAAAGIDQFLDIGCGIPSFGAVHETVRAAAPGARVVYVDHDPVAVAHARAVVDGEPQVDAVFADLRKPRDILGSYEVRALIDLDKPTALLLAAILHFVEDAYDPYAAVGELRDATASGSLLAVTHISYEGIPVPQEQAAGAVGVYKDIRNPLIMRSRAEIARFFEGYDMVEPGLVPMPQWRADTELDEYDECEAEDPWAFSGFAGVGRKR